MKKEGNVKLFVIGTYVLFILLLLVTAGLMFGLKNDVVTAVAKNVCAWSPTIVLLLFFSKLKPGMSRKDFFGGLFKASFSAKQLILVVLLQIVIFAGSVCLYSYFGHVAIKELIQFSAASVAFAFLNSLTSGATGEESGWRGYLQPLMAEKYGVLKGSILVGIIWGFWHAPLWLVSGEYVGIELVKYICLFLIFVISTSVIIGVLYQKNQNILLPMVIHFFVNFTMAFIKTDLLDILVYISLFYLLSAVGFAMWDRRK